MKAKQKPVVEIVGDLGRQGIYGLPVGRKGPWPLCFTFDSWTGPDGEPQKRPLMVQGKRASDNRIWGLREAFKARDTLRVRVRLGKDRAELVKIIGKEPDNKDSAGHKKKPQQTVWKHADLGTFKFDELGWVKSLALPAFKVFKYDSEGGRARSFKTDLRFAADLPEDLPTSRMIAVAMKVIKNQESLANKLKKSLFDAINGRGPQSGMWWHGNIQAINESIVDEGGMRKVKPLTTPADLERLLGRPAIDIRQSVYGFDKPCAILSFCALFEPEHAVGILTDGVRILGLGDSVDVTPFTPFE